MNLVFFFLRNRTPGLLLTSMRTSAILAATVATATAFSPTAVGPRAGESACSCFSRPVCGAFPACRRQQSRQHSPAADERGARAPLRAANSRACGARRLAGHALALCAEVLLCWHAAGSLQLKSATCKAARSGAASLSMISNPFGKKPEAPKKPWGNENPYRIFGVNEEAPYEEVERAFKELVAENEGNEKYIMQLEMMKEDIFDQRLRARMSGALKSKVKESPFDAKLQVRRASRMHSPIMLAMPVRAEQARVCHVAPLRCAPSLLLVRVQEHVHLRVYNDGA